MNVCANCFRDEEIKQFIATNHPFYGKCDFCGKKSYMVDLEELSDFFNDLLGLYVKDDTGANLVDSIQNEWNIFTSHDVAYQILSSIIARNNLEISINDGVSYCEDIRSCLSAWEKLKTEVREEKRYFADLQSFNWDAYITEDGYAPINKDTVLYRARITPEGRKKLKPKEMGCPPKGKAPAGRANPLGIPYLYLCDKIDTTFYEVRAVYLDKISVGKFRILRDLNIVDFTAGFNLFVAHSNSGMDGLTDTIKRNIIFSKISADLSKPLRRYDTEIDYVPTQLICEYCKLRGADGIRFGSSLHEKGTNVVLFNSSDAKCISVKSKEISKVTISC